MKKLFVLFALFPFVAVAQGVEGTFTDRLEYTIFDQHGVVVDQTTYDRKVGLPFRDAMYLKYVRVLRCFGEDADTFIKVDDEFKKFDADPKALSEIKAGNLSPMRNVFEAISSGGAEKK